jgi:hypothetical protein
MTTTPPSENTLARWYYADANNQPVGPVTVETLHSLLLSGTITFDTLVLPKDGGSQWQPCHTVFTGQKPLVPIPPRTMIKTEATQKCPFCAELISIEAKKCKHCGETLDVTLRAAEEAKRNAQNPMVFMNAAGGGTAVISSDKKRFPHLIHLLVTLCTWGLWGIIWLLHYLFRDRNYYR